MQVFGTCHFNFIPPLSSRRFQAHRCGYTIDKGACCIKYPPYIYITNVKFIIVKYTQSVSV